jgi:hypothetical protein
MGQNFTTVGILCDSVTHEIVWQSDVTYIDYEAVALALCDTHVHREGWVRVPHPNDECKDMDTTSSTLTSDTITDEQIHTLCVEADEQGDLDMVRICRKALDGSKAMRKECAKVINNAVAATMVQWKQFDGGAVPDEPSLFQSLWALWGDISRMALFSEGASELELIRMTEQLTAALRAVRGNDHEAIERCKHAFAALIEAAMNGP